MKGEVQGDAVHENKYHRFEKQVGEETNLTMHIIQWPTGYADLKLWKQMWDENINLGIICIKVIIKIRGPEITHRENAREVISMKTVKERLRLNYDQYILLGRQRHL